MEEHRSRSPFTVLREEQNSMRRAVPTLRVKVVGKPEVKGKGQRCEEREDLDFLTCNLRTRGFRERDGR